MHDEEAQGLAQRVNRHNIINHPLDHANWNSVGITLSQNYAGPVKEMKPIPPTNALVQYTTPHGVLLTDDDRAFLDRARVKW
jgi:hypothetical protein